MPALRRRAQSRLQGRAIDNSGSLAADGDITLLGDIVRNSGAIRSAATLQVRAQGDIDNSAGTLYAARLEIGSAAGGLVNRGGHISQGGSAGLDLSSASLRN